MDLSYVLLFLQKTEPLSCFNGISLRSNCIPKLSKQGPKQIDFWYVLFSFYKKDMILPPWNILPHLTDQEFIEVLSKLYGR